MKHAVPFFLAALVASTSLVLSQNAPAKQERTPVINQRQLNQKERIRGGVKSGQLTPRETRRLKAEERKIQQDKLKAKSDGSVSPAERRKLRHEENKASRDIRRLKHNDRTR